MKHVIAFIRPSREGAVCGALHAITGVSGATFSDVRGFGQKRRDGKVRDYDETMVGSLPQVRVDVMGSTVVDLVVKTIVDAAHTGIRGDGKVFVVPLESAVRVSSKEAGPVAV